GRGRLRKSVGVGLLRVGRERGDRRRVGDRHVRGLRRAHARRRIMKRAALFAFLSAGLLLPAIATGAPTPAASAGQAIELQDDKREAVAEVLVLHATNDGKG